jgi:hypothetical protein
MASVAVTDDGASLIAVLAGFRVGRFADDGTDPREPEQARCGRCGSRSRRMPHSGDGPAFSASLADLARWALAHECRPARAGEVR